MPMSMTGFGRGKIDAPFGRIVVEIQSINRKHLEIFISMPKDLGQVETELRKWIGESVHRGYVTVKVYILPSQDAILDFLPDLEVLKTIKAGWDKIAAELGVDSKQIDLPFLVSYASSSKTESLDEKHLPLFRKCVKEALQALEKMKEEEGKSLILDMQSRLKSIRKMVSEISDLSPHAADRMREKLLDKIKTLFPKDVDLDERIAREIALYSEKIDIVEELTRLHSHFSQFEHCFQSARGAIGKKMEFILQEINREINTIGSKSSETRISSLVVEIKSELERIREQIQNIE